LVAAIDLPDGLLGQSPVHPFAQKHSTSVVGQISAIGSPVSPDQEGRLAIVTNVAVGCGGRMFWRETNA
jgi:hypothetical protein